MGYKHLDFVGTVHRDSKGIYITDKCRKCGATRTYTRTSDGFMLGGYWTELEDNVKRKGPWNEQDEPD